jgi:hypothetical protein
MSAIRFISLAAVLCSTLLTGCGSGGRTVTGTVKYQGKPVVFGSVVMIGSNGVSKSGVIQPDGTFKIEGVVGKSPKIAVSSPPPPGVKVATHTGGRDAVDSEKPQPAAAEPVNPEIVKNWFPIPSVYGDPNSSGLAIEIQGDKVDIDLKYVAQERSGGGGMPEK